MVLEPLPPLDDLERMWRALDATGTHSFFVSWTWIGTWLRALPPASAPSLLKTMRGTEAVAIALLARRRTKLHGIIPVRQCWLNGSGDPALDCIMIEHNGFASADSASGEIYSALLRWFEAECDDADELALPGIEPGALTNANSKLLRADRMSPAFRTSLASVDARAGIEPLLSRNARQQLRRSLRACERKGPLSLEIARDTKSALEYFDAMKAMHMRSWTRRGRRHAFADPFFEMFHRALIARGLEEGNVDLMRVSAGRYALGYLYNFRRNGTVSSYQSGFDDSEAELRPGYVCHALAMAHYAAAGMTQYDFLAGANRLKQSFGPERYELCWRRLRKPTRAFRAEDLARRILDPLRGRG